MAKSRLGEWVGIDLKGFGIIEMTEVYRVDTDGHKVVSLGFFMRTDVAAAFAGSQTDAAWHKTRRALVLTNGTVGFVVDQQEAVKLFNDEEEAFHLREKAIAKLSPEERRILGFEDPPPPSA